MSDSAALWTVVCQASLSLEFSRQEYWSGLPCSPLVDLPNQGIEPICLTLAGFLPVAPPRLGEKPWQPGLQWCSGGSKKWLIMDKFLR